MTEQRFEFVVTEQDYAHPNDRYLVTLGDYDLDCATASGPTPSAAITEWLHLHGDTIDGEAQ